MSARPLTLTAYPAASVQITEGVLKGEPLTFADGLVMDDHLRVETGARPHHLHLTLQNGHLHHFPDTGTVIHLDCCLTLMDPLGNTHEALILVDVDGETAAEVYLLPLSDMVAGSDYQIVGIARHTATRRFAETAVGGLAAGTRITLADGRMQEIETLRPGDMILTRDAGRQPLRHLQQSTQRASGDFAPVRIAEGAMNNAAPLAVRPDQGLFVYQRQDRLGAGRAEVMIRARQLVNGSDIMQVAGGFVAYYQMVFDAHHIVFAEGIAVESHLVDARTRASLPPGLLAEDHETQAHHAYAVDSMLIPQAEAARILRLASAGQGPS